MVTDLFVKRKPARIRLYKWMLQKKHAKSSDIIRWGFENYCNHPLRRLRELRAEGKVKKMAETKKISYYGLTRESAYEVITWTNTPVTRLGNYVR